MFIVFSLSRLRFKKVYTKYEKKKIQVGNIFKLIHSKVTA